MAGDRDNDVSLVRDLLAQAVQCQVINPQPCATAMQAEEEDTAFWEWWFLCGKVRQQRLLT